MAAFLRPALHYHRPGLFDLPALLVCAQLAELIVVIVFDDNLHPRRPTRQVSTGTSDLIDRLATTVGPPLVLLLLAVVLLLGSLGELLLGVVGIGAGALLIVATVGPGGVATYVTCVVLLRVTVWVLHEVLSYPLRLLGVLALLSLVVWVVTL